MHKSLLWFSNLSLASFTAEKREVSSAKSLTSVNRLLQAPLIQTKKTLVQELTPGEHLLLPNFEHVTMCFETEHLSSFDVISKGLQKCLLFCAWKWNHHAIPYQKSLVQTNRIPLDKRRVWTHIGYYPNNKNETTNQVSYQSSYHRASRYFLA